MRLLLARLLGLEPAALRRARQRRTAAQARAKARYNATRSRLARRYR